MTDVGDQLIREVEEDLQRERWLRLWRAWGRQAVAVVVVVVLTIAGYTGWNEYRDSRLAGDAYLYWQSDRLAVDGGSASAIASFNALVEDGHGGYPWLAGMREAQLLAESGDRELALQRYDELAAMDDVLPVWRQLAALYAVMLVVDHADPGDVEARLEPLLDGNWHVLAMEIQGLLHLRTGDNEAAASSFRAIIEAADAPSASVRRAMELLAATPGGH